MENFKKCFKCNTEKNTNQFYKNNRLKDGYLGKCKDCAREDSKKDYYIKSEDPIFLENERIRCRERNIRLGYGKRTFDIVKDVSNIYKNLNKKMNIQKGFEVHHWSYEKQSIKDVFILKRSEHRKSHIYLKRKKDEYFFKTEDGIELDTREKHFKYLVSKGIIF